MNTKPNRDFLKELRDIISRATLKHPEPLRPPRVKRFKLLVIDGTLKREVGWNLLYHEAVILSNVLVRRIRRLREPSESGSPLFEITSHEVIPCQENS